MGQPVLHSFTIPQPSTTINRLHMLFHGAAVVALLYYRVSHLFFRDVPFLPWSLMTLSELLLAVTWLLQQPFRWRRVTRETYPENITVPDSKLPRIDVFVCTVDPKKEPVFAVMNTVVSAMSLDYPPEKLAVYLSDDGGAPLTRFSVKLAGEFARSWVPFVKKYGLKNICPQAFFSRMGDDDRLLRSASSEFQEDQKQIKSLYEEFKKKVEKAREPGEIGDGTVADRSPHVEVLHDGKTIPGGDNVNLPLLVYLSRERRPSEPHHFKGGALNALLRVSELMSNAPYLLVLDCDMFCHESATARQAMCFHLDEKAFPDLAFVQFPQTFYNTNEDDIYCAEGNTTYKSQWHGMDGLGGPMLSGTGYYMKRNALFGNPKEKGALKGDEKNVNLDLSSPDVLEKANTLATCAFEKNTKWGTEIGFSYFSMLESSFTGYLLHCRGWTSVYYYPKRNGFLGCAPADLKEAADQILKWISGLLQVGLSRVNPITYGMANMSISMSFCYGFVMYLCLYTISLGLYGIVPQVYFVKGVPLYPKVSDSWFALFVIIKASSIFEQLYEVLRTGGTVKSCWNEYRIWMIQSITGLLFGIFDATMNILGLAKVKFRLSNKVVDEDKLKEGDKGKFNLQGAGKFIVPLAAYVVLTVVCLILGVKRMVSEKSYDDMFGQFLLSSLLGYVSYSIIEGLASMKR